jgi:hypothetical protein
MYMDLTLTGIMNEWNQNQLSRGELFYKLLRVLQPSNIQEVERCFSHEMLVEMAWRIADGAKTDAEWKASQMYDELGPGRNNTARPWSEENPADVQYRRGVETLREYMAAGEK